MSKTVIITRHAGAIEWLKSKGYGGEVMPHFNGEVEEGATYIGVLPIPMIHHIINGGGRFILLTLPQIAFGERGQELSPEEMEAAGASLHLIWDIVMTPIG